MKTMGLVLAAVPAFAIAQAAAPVPPPQDAAPPPHYTAPPRYAQPPLQYAQPPLQYAQPPLQYAQPPPQYAQPPLQYAQPPPQYAQPPLQYAQPPPQYAVPPPQYPQYPQPQYTPAPPQYAPPPQLAAVREQRGDWYVSFAAGGGDARLTFKDPPQGFDETFSLRDVYGKSPTKMSFDLQFGTRLSPQVLFGVDLSWFAAFDDYAAPFDESHLSLNIGTVTANATLFPLRTGPFLRAGLGFARFWARATFPDAPTLTPEAEGFAATAGVGYAVQLGQRFALTVSLDVSAQTYPDADPDAPDTSSLWTLRGGFGWY